MKKLVLFLLAFFALPAAAQTSPCYWGPNNLVRCFSSLSGISLAKQQFMQFGDAATNYVQVQAPSAVTTYTLTLPDSQGASGTYLRNDGTGILSWAAATGSGAAGTVTSVGTGTGLTGGPITGSGVISLATTGTAGTYTKVLTDAYGRVTSGTTLLPSDVPTLNQDTTGTASNVTGTVALGNGGTGQTTQQAAIDVLAGAQSAGKYLRSDGTHTTLSALQATDVTGTVAVGNGGTGIAAGTSGGVLAFTGTGTVASSGALAANQLIVGGGAGATPSTLAAGSQYQVLTMGASSPGYGAVALNQSSAVSGTLAVGNGGTGAGALTSNGVIYGGGTGAVSALAPNSSATNEFLTNSSSGAPAWAAIQPGDLPLASASQAGAVSVSAQTLAGAKTFQDGIVGLTSGFQTAVSDATTTAAPFKGAIGEYVECITANASTAVTASFGSVCSVVLTPGDWDVSASVVYDGPGSAENYIAGAISTASSSPTANYGQNACIGMVLNASGLGSCAIPRYRVTVTSNTTYHLDAAGSGASASGLGTTLSARRAK